MSSNRRQRGASLLEVLTATALMASLAAIAVPNLSGLSIPTTLRAATQQIAADMHVARLRAIAMNTRCRVTFNAAANTYTLDREVTANNFVADGGVQHLPMGVSLGTISPQNPMFDSRGMLSGTVTVPVQATNGETKTITINVLGKATIG